MVREQETSAEEGGGYQSPGEGGFAPWGDPARSRPLPVCERQRGSPQSRVQMPLRLISKVAVKSPSFCWL